MKIMKTLYITDLDGTLMHDDKSISKETDNNSDGVARWLRKRELE